MDNKNYKSLIVCPDIEFNNYRGIQSVYRTLSKYLESNGHNVILLTGAHIPKANLTARTGDKVKSQLHKTFLKQYLNLGRNKYLQKLKLNRRRNILSEVIYNSLVPHSQHIELKTSSKSSIFYFTKEVINSPHIYQLIDLCGTSFIIRQIVHRTIKTLVRKHKIDNIYLTSPSFFPYLKHTTIKTYIHDIMPLILKEEPIENKTVYRFTKSLLNSVSISEELFVNSNDTSEKLKLLGIETKTFLLKPDLADNYAAHSNINIDLSSIYPAKSGTYFYFVSALEKRKNLISLIKGYLLSFNQTNKSLIISGNPGYEFDKILDYLHPLWESRNIVLISYTDKIKISSFKGSNKFSSKNISKNTIPKIIFTGYVKEPVKKILLKNCFAFVFPSLYEGYGIPILEARAFNKPIISSIKGGLKEVVDPKKDIVLENPSDSIKIAQAMISITN